LWHYVGWEIAAPVRSYKRRLVIGLISADAIARSFRGEERYRDARELWGEV